MPVASDGDMDGGVPVGGTSPRVFFGVKCGFFPRSGVAFHTFFHTWGNVVWVDVVVYQCDVF